MEEEFSCPDVELANERMKRFGMWQHNLPNPVPKFTVFRKEVFEWVNFAEQIRNKPMTPDIRRRGRDILILNSETLARMALQIYVMFLEKKLKIN